MLNTRFFARLGVVLGILSWLALTGIDLIILFSSKTNVPAGIGIEFSDALLNVFIFSVFLFYRYRIGKADSFNFLDMLWRVFVTGLVATIISLFMQGFLLIMQGTRLAENNLLINFFYHINTALVILFLISSFIVWKRLILYQKSRNLVRLWYVFENVLLITVLFNLVQQEAGETIYNILLVFLSILAIILSANLKWVAYLNFKQKWRGLLLIILSILYLVYFFYNLLQYPNSALVSNILGNLFIQVLFGFILIYAVFSFLVILFNLPTSSVFEQKLEEILNFQRLSQTIQSGQRDDQVYDILLDSAVSTTLADAAWIEVRDPDGKAIFYNSDITQEEVAQLKGKAINKKHLIRDMFRPVENEGVSQARIDVEINEKSFRSLITFPLVIQKQRVGFLVLLKNVMDGFNKEMIDIVTTFVNQACISLENVRLLQQALENERYQEELKIAKKVQRSLLPKELPENLSLSVSAFSEAASEVGGDYYDLYRINENQLALIIGDVSGKGTSAAFHMSQMKGVFHSLVQLNLGIERFIEYANSALSRCLERGSFITVSFFVIDTEKKQLSFCRAGHCPTLYYSARKKEVQYYQGRGLGLGMVRNESFNEYVYVDSIAYQPNDLILLYTDGITEAKNPEGKEYGYERLAEYIQQHGDLESDRIKEGLLQDVYDFCNGELLEDDYTALIVKLH